MEEVWGFESAFCQRPSSSLAWKLGEKGDDVGKGVPVAPFLSLVWYPETLWSLGGFSGLTSEGGAGEVIPL